MFRRKSYALLAISGLFFQLLVAGFHIPPALAMAGIASAPTSFDSPYRTIVICTYNGLKTIVIDENNQPIDGNTPTRTGGSICPICQSLTSDLDLVDADILVRDEKTDTGNELHIERHQLDKSSPLIVLARGPPTA